MTVWTQEQARGREEINSDALLRHPKIRKSFFLASVQRSPPSSICMEIFTVPVPAQQKYNLFSSASLVARRVVLLLSRYRNGEYFHTNGRRRGSLLLIYDLNSAFYTSGMGW